MSGTGDRGISKSVRIAALCLGFLSGCGVQVGTGLHAHSPRTAWAQSAEISARWHLVRESGFFGGFDVGLSDPAPESSFGIRHLRATAGLRLLQPCYALEIGPELAIGEPAFSQFVATGMYTGLSTALLVRVSGTQDTRVGFAPAGILVDLVTTARGGVWTPPYGWQEDHFWDASLVLGARLTIVSDLAVASSKGWEAR